MKHTIREEVHGVLILVAVLWAVFLIDLVVPIEFAQWGVRPRTVSGLVGIPLMPFLHASFGHLLSNTIPLVILLVLLAGSRANSWLIVVQVVLGGGALLWLFGRSADHVGASGLIYGLIAFLIVSGLLERRLIPLGIALLVGFLYGTTLISGVIPRFGDNVSWDGHLLGACAGGAIAYLHTRGSDKEITDDLSLPTNKPE